MEPVFVPAATGQYATVISVVNNDGNEPTLKDVVMRRVPIAAWKIEQGDGDALWATPILPYYPYDPYQIAFVSPEGHVTLFKDKYTFDTMDEALDVIMIHADAAWCEKTGESVF